MSTSSLVSEELPPPTPTQPRGVAALVAVSAACSVLATLLMTYAGTLLRDYNHGGAVSTTVMVILVALSVAAWIPALLSFGYAQRRAKLLGDDKLVEARRVAARGRELALIGMGYAVAVLVVAGVLIFVLANNGGVASTFFSRSPIQQSFKDVLKGFWTNMWAACVAEVLVLVLGLVVAVI